MPDVNISTQIHAGGSLTGDPTGQGGLGATNDLNAGFHGNGGMRGGPDVIIDPDLSTSDHRYIPRYSYTYPAPGAKALLRARPDTTTWQPTLVAGNDNYGRIQVIIGGKDVTYLDGKAIPLPEWESTEPYGDSIATIHLPTISPFSSMRATAYKWARTGQQVAIYMWVGSTRIDLFRGFVYNYRLAEGMLGWKITCPGVLYHLSFQVQRQFFLRHERDIGDVIRHYVNEQPAPRYEKMSRKVTGVKTFDRGAFQNDVLNNGITPLLASCYIDNGTKQYTLTNVGRKAVLRLKNTTTKHWTVSLGGHGVDCTGLEGIPGANATYGEGTDPTGRYWRNSKWPNYRPLNVPLLPSGTLFYPGGSTSGFREFAAQLRAVGYPMKSGDKYLSRDERIVEDFQDDKGILANGIVGGQTWNAAFNAGLHGDALDGAYIGSLFIYTAVAKYLHDADGAVTGPNPNFDPNVLRIERHNNYGANVYKTEGRKSAKEENIRLRVGPQWAGDIVLTQDPEEGSRLQIKAGQNIFVRYLYDDEPPDGTLFHISHVRQTVDQTTITVSSAAHDYVTLAQIAQHKRDNSDPARIPGTTRRRSKQTQDQVVVWDSENGSGIIPRHSLYGGLFSVIKVPAGEVGTIVESRFDTSPNTRFAVLMFDRPVTSNWLHKILGARAAVLDNDAITANADRLKARGMFAAWGGEGQNLGFYPGFETKGASLTGVGYDDGSLSYSSEYPPWIWVAELAQTSCYISGRLKNAPML